MSVGREILLRLILDFLKGTIYYAFKQLSYSLQGKGVGSVEFIPNLGKTFELQLGLFMILTKTKQKTSTLRALMQQYFLWSLH